MNVEALNLLQLAPGGHLGRFIIWTESAFKKLDLLYGTESTPSTLKKNFSLPKSLVTNPNLARLINSSEIQSVVKVAGDRKTKRPFTLRKNPLKNMGVMVRLNPYAQTLRRNELKGFKGKKTVAKKGLHKEFVKNLLANE